MLIEINRQIVFKLILIFLSLSLSSCDDFFTKSVKLGGNLETTTKTTDPTAGSGTTAPADDDADGLSNEVENTLGLNPIKADTDNDGFSDGIEFVGRLGDPLNSNISPSPLNKKRILDPMAVVIGEKDSDKDGLSDTFEKSISLDPLSFDTDEDGYSDSLELIASSDPKNASSRPSRTNPPSSDGGDHLDVAPADNDNDGIANDLELTLNNSNKDLEDTDTDGYSDSIEYLMGSEADNELSIPSF